MAENKMAEVARLFGKKQGERFRVKFHGFKFDCVFCDGRFEVWGKPEFAHDFFDEVMFYALCSGEAVIVND